jgi:chromosome segregation ATPase
MDKIKDLLFDLEKKVESNLNELLTLKEQNNELLDKNKSLINERNDLMLDLESLEERFKALKIANTITGSENNINETRGEINSLIREIDLCISQLSE